MREVLLDHVHGAGWHPLIIEQRGERLAQRGAMKADDARSTREPGHQSGLDQPLEVDRQIEALAAQPLERAEQGAQAAAAVFEDFAGDAPAIQQLAELRLDNPGDAHASSAQGLGGGQSVQADDKNVLHGIRTSRAAQRPRQCAG